MRKIKRKYIIKYNNFIYTIFIILILYVSVIIIDNFKLFSSNQEFILDILESSNNYTYEEKKIISTSMNKLFKVDFKEPTTFLSYMFNYDNKEAQMINNISDIIISNKNDDESAKVYIYNSHQLENYSKSNYEVYNITPSIMTASYLMQESLNKQGISSIVEESSFNDYIKQNNWDYNYSYQASRFFINLAKDNYKNLTYFMDIHRDSIKYDYSTIKINELMYAKVMFVVGLENPNYQSNLDLMNKINDKLNQAYPGLSRGVIKKEGPNVNGVYNQDISPNSILIEVGGYENKIDEVYNTINVLGEIIGEIINEKI